MKYLDLLLSFTLGLLVSPILALMVGFSCAVWCLIGFWKGFGELTASHFSPNKQKVEVKDVWQRHIDRLKDTKKSSD
jgi:hypothetical protein